MNQTTLLTCTLVIVAIIGLTVCATTSTETVSKSPQGAPAVVSDQPIAKAQQSDVDALAVIGCDITKQEPTYVEGRRPKISDVAPPLVELFRQ